MAIERTGPRLTIKQQVSRKPEFRGKLLAVTAMTAQGGVIRATEAIKKLTQLIAAGIRVEIRTPEGNLLDPAPLIGKTPKQIDTLAREVDALTGIDKLRKAEAAGLTRKAGTLEIEMIDDFRLPFRVAKNVVIVSLLEGRKISEEYNENNPGSKLRIPTEPELLKLNELLGDQLKGNNDWIWTETESEDYEGQFVLRHRYYDGRYCRRPDSTYYFNPAVRFVEDR